MPKRYTIREYEGFTRGGHGVSPGLTPLPEQTFDMLECMVLMNRREDGCAAPMELMSLGARTGVGKTITARNYVGVVAARDGTEIEILPKAASADGEESNAVGRKLLLHMLLHSGEVPFKTFDSAHLDTARMRLLELFVEMFLREVQQLAQRGFKSGYSVVQENAVCLRGKLLFSKHIRTNLIHQERMYVEHDVFSANCPENRIIKSALCRLERFSHSPACRRDLQNLLGLMETVPESENLERDLSRFSCMRLWESYRPVLDWCRIFLSGRSFTSFHGKETALALLFPMELVFERYTAAALRRYLDRDKYALQVQDAGRWLFDSPEKQFRIQPDLVILDRVSGTPLAVLDTKWKRISDDSQNSFVQSILKNVSQADIYQLLAYQREYGVSQTALLYPSCDHTSTAFSDMSSQSGNRVRIQLLDLWSQEGIAKTVEDLCK